MEIFAFTLVAAFLASWGGADQRLTSDLAGKLGAGPGLVAVSVLCAFVTAAAMAWLGAEVSSWLIGRPRAYLIAGTLIAAAAMLLIPVVPASPKEPTRSLGAIALVLMVRQIVDPVRLLIFAAAAAKAAPEPAFWGGALGSAGALICAIQVTGASPSAPRIRSLRQVIAIGFAVLGVVVVLIAHGPIA